MICQMFYDIPCVIDMIATRQLGFLVPWQISMRPTWLSSLPDAHSLLSAQTQTQMPLSHHKDVLCETSDYYLPKSPRYLSTTMDMWKTGWRKHHTSPTGQHLWDDYLTNKHHFPHDPLNGHPHVDAALEDTHPPPPDQATLMHLMMIFTWSCSDIPIIRLICWCYYSSAIVLSQINIRIWYINLIMTTSKPRVGSTNLLFLM